MTRFLKQYVLYGLVVAPFVALDIWLVQPRSHAAEWVVLGFVVFVGLSVKGPLQRRFWP